MKPIRTKRGVVLRVESLEGRRLLAASNPLTNNATFNTITSSRFADGQMTIYALDSTGQVMQNWQPNAQTATSQPYANQWDNWQKLALVAGTPAQPAPFKEIAAVQAPLDGQQEIFAIDDSGELWFTLQTGSGLFGEWSHPPIANPDTFQGGAVSALEDGQLELWLIGTNGSLMYSYETSAASDSPSWSPLEPAPMTNVPTNPKAVSASYDAGDNKGPGSAFLNIYVIDSSGNLYGSGQVTSSPGSSYTPFSLNNSLNVSKINQINVISNLDYSGPTVNGYSSGGTQFYWFNQTNSSGGTQIVSAIDEGLAGLDLHSPSNPPGETSIPFDGAGDVYYSPQLTYSPPGLTGPPFSPQAITVGQMADGQMELWATSSNGTLWTTYQTSTDDSTPWSSWSQFATPGFAILPSPETISQPIIDPVTQPTSPPATSTVVPSAPVPPSVVVMHSVKNRKKQITSIQVIFNEPMNAVQIIDPAHYQLQTSSGKGRHMKTVPLKIASVVYDSSLNEVTIRLAKPFTTNAPLQLSIPAGSTLSAGGTYSISHYEAPLH